jgi:beta-glucosidase
MATRGTRSGRRDFLGQSLAIAGGGLLRGKLMSAAVTAPAEGAPAPKAVTFPRGFIWGSATAAYQIEGAAKEDGRGESIWDRFARTPGKVKNGDTGDVACDSYHRWQEDIALLKAMNLRSYRFSVAWPRIQPTGQGAVNARGLDYYSRLVDGLLAAGIRPSVTLYHWDLPQVLEDAGGWPNRETADRFSDYARIVVRALGDRVKNWMVFNEPNVFTLMGYGMGFHAPGKRDFDLALRAAHVVNLAQGDAFRVLRSEVPKARVSGAYTMAVFEPATGSDTDRDAARRWQLFWNSWHVDPALRGTYPDAFPEGLAERAMGLKDGDMRRTRASLDFIGLNHYNRYVVSTAEPSDGPLAGTFGGGNVGSKTDLDWEVWPKGFYDVVMWLTREYRRPIIEVTENGCAYNDGPDAHGNVNDTRRIAFYRGYLAELARAIQDGADVRGYHAWSLLDNFEWGEGYSQRFGLVHVDFKTGQRTLKESGRWYGEVAATNALPA